MLQLHSSRTDDHADIQEKYKFIQNKKYPLKAKIKCKDPTQLITIINIYAPHTGRLKEEKTELDELYTRLGKLINKYKNKVSILLLIAGDFNAKIGVRTDMDTCMGKYSRGRRNNSGQQLVEFCEAHNLFISNSSFQHPARHITTWQQSRKDKRTNKIKMIYNQIDYIIVSQKQKHALLDARSYNGTEVFSDHRMVVTTMRSEWFILCKKSTSRSKEKTSNRLNVEMLNDIEVRN